MFVFFLRQAFGSPGQEPTGTSDGKLGWYAAKTSGAAIQFGYDDKRTQVVVLRPTTREKVFENITRSSQEGK